MCGFGCGGGDGIGYFVANLLYVSERLASCCAATAVVVCLVVTLLVMLALGVGLGYNYCVIDTKLLSAPPPPLEDDPVGQSSASNRRKRHAGTPASAPRWPAPTDNLLQVEDSDLKPTMVIPLRKYDLHSLFAKLRKNNRNVTLELVQ